VRSSSKNNRSQLDSSHPRLLTNPNNKRRTQTRLRTPQSLQEREGTKARAAKAAKVEKEESSEQ